MPTHTQEMPDFNKPRVKAQQPSYEAHLPLTATIFDDEGDGEVGQPMTLIGYTQTMSNDAFSLVGPFYHFGYRYLMGRDRSLQIELHLPAANISLQGFPVRYTKLDEGVSTDGYMMTGADFASFGESDVNCLIEVSIVVISDSDRALLAEYLRQLSAPESTEQAQTPALKLVRPKERAA
ncbi:MAG: hypothetical protein QOF02_4121 [Blastocatellia bacterium]|jgi:hypothetical protein|nr:hypothetical protein [Blastocatellia bacterium]